MYEFTLGSTTDVEQPPPLKCVLGKPPTRRCCRFARDEDNEITTFTACTVACLFTVVSTAFVQLCSKFVCILVFLCIYCLVFFSLMLYL